MQISSISGAAATTDVQSTSSKRASSIPPAMGTTPAATKNISPGGDLMGKLQQLLQQDPAKFKEVVTKLSGDIKTAAGKASGDQSTFLNKLADNLSQAASSGSMAPLQPSGAKAAGGSHKHHGGHHKGGGGAAGGAMQQIVQGALDQVNQALGSSASASAATTSATASATSSI